jgi:Protein of unknwon function (DUF3310)
MSANNKQVGGTHYAKYGDYQPWEVLRYWLTPEEYRGWQKGNAIVYLAREQDKNKDQDIEKAAHHLEKLIEVNKEVKYPKQLGDVMQVWQGKPLEWELDAMDNRNE